MWTTQTMGLHIVILICWILWKPPLSFIRFLKVFFSCQSKPNEWKFYHTAHEQSSACNFFVAQAIQTTASFPAMLTFRSFSSLSRKYSRYRSAQRAIARQLYLRKHLRMPYRRPKLTRPVRPKQRSYYARRVTPESLGLEEYDRSTIHSAGAASEHGAKAQ